MNKYFSNNYRKNEWYVTIMASAVDSDLKSEF